MISKFLNKHLNFGLLILRFVLGGMFVYHGLPKISGGMAKWEGPAAKGQRTECRPQCVLGRFTASSL